MTISTTLPGRHSRAGTSPKESAEFWLHSILWCALGCLLVGCATTPGPRLEQARRSQPILGTFVVISACGQDRSLLNDAISAAFDEIRRVDAMMSLHRPDSELAALNQNAARKPQAVSEDLFRIVDKALVIAAATDGSFDPTVGPLIQQWGFLWKDHRLPEAAELLPALERVGHQFVKLDKRGRTIAFARDGIVLDLNAIAKGFAVDCAIDKLRAHGISNAMVRAGGDLRVMGAPPGQNAWKVQIEDPAKRGARHSIQLRDAAISTSGSYENFFEVDGKRYSHVLNPSTGLPVGGILACTVIADTCMESDAWATALFVHGPEKSMAEFPQRAFRFVLDSGQVVTSRGFPIIEP